VLVRLRPLLRRIGRGVVAGTGVVFATVAYTWITTPDVRPLRAGAVTDTAFMRMRADEPRGERSPQRVVHRWVPYGQISPVLTRAVLVTEDAAFWEHDGLDYHEIKASLAHGFSSGGQFRGASTITQQLAKNLYLSPSRSPYRKLKELFITRRLEAELSKTRILEIYLNVIEWGDGIWGAEAAARTYFGVSAAALDSSQAALLAAAIFNPRGLNPARPSRALARRQQMILRRMGGAADGGAPPPPTLEAFPVTSGLPPGIIKREPAGRDPLP
jgi:monofunctional biosynthetic peptidoglycan transglycosylase